ncbi:phosphate/phosphite/phosphonate ABC transporter substrate-binding protein [Candidatus Leptofilum sp.]|uniref:phosphate/phosphite/phosphonate ABC transporter substrate-binding protein n=1 Tax=Candidatus Leptofilum sp. TaxID=3241576 RepID=UPI003B5BAD21
MRRLWGLVFIGFAFFTACASSPEVLVVTRIVPSDTAVSPPAPIEVTVEVPVEVTRLVTETVTVVETVVPDVPSLGSAERPFQLLFAPVADTAVISSRAQVLADWLTEQSGQQFQVGLLDNEQRIIDLMCAAPAETIGFLTAVGVALANQQCGAQVLHTAVQVNEMSWQAGMIVVRRDSEINELADLDGKSWAIPSESSIPNNWYFQALLAAEGIEPGEIVSVPGDNTAMLAVLNGDVDFATGTYLPPLMPFLERDWVFGEDDPEIWRQTGVSPSRSGIGFVVVLGRPENGGYRVRDARSGVFDTAEEIFEETRILTLSAPIPAASVAVGGEFPIGPAQQFADLLTEFVASDLCSDSLCAPDFYGWIGLETAVPANYDPLHFVIDTLGWTDEAVLITE